MPLSEDLRQLSPEERIKKLKEREDESRKEIEEAETLISESMREIGEEQERKDMPIPQLKSSDISQLFTIEEKQLFETKRFVSSATPQENAPAERRLEEVAEAEASTQSARRGAYTRGYGEAIEHAKSEHNPMEIYNQKKSVTQESSEEARPYEPGTVTGVKYEKKQKEEGY